MKELCENWEMQFEVGQVTGFEEKDGRMTEIRVTGADGVTRRMPLDHLLVFFRSSAQDRPDCRLGTSA